MSPRTFSRRGPFNTSRAVNIEPLALRIALAVHREACTGEQLRHDHAARASTATDIPRAIALAAERGWIVRDKSLGRAVRWVAGTMPEAAEKAPARAA